MAREIVIMGVPFSHSRHITTFSSHPKTLISENPGTESGTVNDDHAPRSVVIKVQDLVKITQACEGLSSEAKEQITALIKAHMGADGPT